MKSRRAMNASLRRILLPLVVLMAGLGFIFFARDAAGSLAQVVQEVFEGAWSSPGFVPFVLGVLCVIYGVVGLLFHREERYH